MKWDARFIFFFIFVTTLCFSANECRTNITPLTDTKKPCDKSATDAHEKHQTNKLDAMTPETMYNNKILCDNQPNDYDYIVEDNQLLQNDQPDRHLRLPYSYGSVRKQPPQYEKNRNHQHRDDQNVEYTKEVVIKQGRLKGLVRRMHAQSGLRNVDQFLGEYNTNTHALKFYFVNTE